MDSALARQGRRIAYLARTAPTLVGLPAAPPASARVEVAPLGSGESYTAWRVAVPPLGDGDGGGGAAAAPEPVVVRILRRPLTELPRAMGEEFAALKAAPPGLGPRPLRLQLDADVLGAPYMVTTLVPGRVLDHREWDTALLTAHARRLAALHARSYDACGGIVAAEGDRSDRLRLTDRLQGSLRWWRGTCPEVFADPDVARLLPRVVAHVERAAPAFDRLRRFALVHGDLVPGNILVEGGTPRYVDWEWAEFGDPAQDLAYLGGPVAAPPWYVPLGQDRVEALLRAYAEAAEAAGRPLDLPDLRVRRDAWEVFERFTTSLYHRSLRGTPADADGRRTRAAHEITAALDARLR
ncbi:phosphotransferase [Streptomonospora sp. S1-112]|uniref:Phosphotransferase n=1 Tax=Streptomonospora mangrovi TaxID=2883123 RepID=A0A9X3NUI9_9ACTN|nr:phosphotransferase [Streptomonospora mangrovi]MDA0564366.1 phosphotransferase [Streptomonospora mangrovi]